MQVTQVYELTNDIVKEALGEGTILEEDLSNVVDIGKSLLSVLGVENYAKKINDKIGRMVFVERVYGGRVPSVLRDGWEYGSILEKVAWDELPEAFENESLELTDGASYDPHIFYKPSLQVQCWNKKVTFEIPISFTDEQVKSAFNSAQQLNNFYSMIETGVRNAMTLRTDSLIQRVVNAMAGETYQAELDNSAAGTGVTGVKAVNLLAEYNDRHAGSEIDDLAVAMDTPDFIQYCAARMGDYVDYLRDYSTLFNVQGKQRFTPTDRLSFVLNTTFKHHADVYLQSGVFHNELTKLPEAESVASWQGTGTDNSIANRTTIKVKTPSGDSVEIKGVLGVMFDRDGVAVANVNPRTTTQYNAKAEFTNYFHKWDAQFLIDTAENCVVFYCDDDNS